MDRVKLAIEQRAATRDGEALAKVRQEMDETYQARVKQPARATAQLAGEGFSPRQKREIAWREASRAQQEEMTGRRRQVAAVAPGQAPVSPPAGAEAEGETPMRIEIVGDDF